MGDVGIKVYNSAGGLQAHNANSTWGQSNTGTATLVDDGMTHPQPMVRGSVTITGLTPLLAIRPRGGVAVGVERVSVGGSTTYYFMAQSSTPVLVDWWAFDAASQAAKDPTLNTVGLKAYDPFGVLTFDAAMPMMRIVGSIYPPMPTAPLGSDQSSTGTFSVPGGSSYAVIIGAIGHVATMYDTGNYTTGSPSVPPDVPITEPEDPDAGPPGGATWREMYLETYIGMVSFDGSSFEAGMTRFEQFRGWYPIGQEEHLIKNGAMTFTVIDVTHFGGGGSGGGTTISVTANNYSPSITGGTPGATLISPAVTISASGGTGPYTVQWFKQGGNTSITNYDDLDDNPFRTSSATQPGGTIRSAVYAARVTDSLGNVGWSDDIIFSFETSSGPDYVPDAISAFSLLQVESNDPDVSWSAGVRKITGINQTITLRFERYNYTGNLAALHVDVYTSTTSATGPWTHHGYFTASNGGSQYLDVAVVNDTWISYNVHAITTSGMKTGACDLVVWNLSNPGGSVKISDVPNNTFKVDADNNYNVPDYTPDAISLTAQSVVTDDWEGYTPGTYFQITGINQPITIRISRGTTTDYENIFTRRLIIGHSTNGGSSYSETNMGALASPIDFTVNNGDWMFLKGYFNTNAGRGSASWTTTVTNATTSTTLGSVLISGTVDNDNNYTPPADYTPDSISLGTMYLSTTSNAGYSSTQVAQITGINQAISLKFTRDNLSITGNILYGRTYIGVASNAGGPWTDYLLTAAAGDSVTVTVSNGMYIRAYAYAETGSGSATVSWNCYVQNMSTGGTLLNTFYGNCYVDTDNNYNLPAELSVSLSTTYLYNEQYAGSGINISTTTNYGDMVVTPSGGTGSYTVTWQRWSGSWGSPWSYTGSTVPQFSYYGTTNYNVWDTVRAVVSDTGGGLVYSDWVDINLVAGDSA